MDMNLDEFKARIEDRAGEIRKESSRFAEDMACNGVALTQALFHWHSREIASCQIALEALQIEINKLKDKIK